MNETIPKLADIPEDELTPLVRALVEIVHRQREQIQELRDEIARLKGLNARPKIEPSRLERPVPAAQDKQSGEQRGKRAGSAKRSKTQELEIHQVVDLEVEDLPVGSVFKGYEEYTVQDILLQPFNTRYRRARWLLPDGSYCTARLPEHIGFGHFGTTLVSFILYQYHHSHVTQPLLLQQLQELGVDISEGQLNRIIIEGKQDFDQEKEEILRVGLQVSSRIHVDDTKARHKGQNGFCTHIGNEIFAFFASTPSKSRINFLSLLRAGVETYVVSDDALQYMKAQGLPAGPLGQLEQRANQVFENEVAWQEMLRTAGIMQDRHVRIATEGALLGSVLERGVRTDLVVMSDDAGQFNVLLHALCWIHAERTLAKLVGFTSPDREALEQVRTQVWELYRELKAYRESPSATRAVELEKQFDDVFGQKTCYVSLNLALDRLAKNKSELLVVLERPDAPLQNNLSERDIREYVKKRKISGSTRSELGRRCRDTFASLKKTCRKLGVPFWDYLIDRISGAATIDPLPQLLASRATAAPP